MAYYTSFSLYIETATSLKDKIDKYDKILELLLTSAENSAANLDVEEYHLDSGQTKIRNTYRDPSQIFKAISSYERLRAIAINKLNGTSVVRLVDGNSNMLKR